MIEELIRANKLKSVYLLVLTILIVMAVGYILGDIIYTMYIPVRSLEYEGKRIIFSLGFAGLTGLLEILQIYFVFTGKPRLLFNRLGMNVAERTKFQKLHNVISEMTIAAGLSQTPVAYVIPSRTLNAMAFGSSPDSCAIAVTAGLLAVCNRDELQGVIAHELSHIINRDALLLEVCRNSLGIVEVLREFMLRSIYWSPVGRLNYRISSGKGRSSGAHLIFLLFGIIFTLIAPILVNVIYLTISREREYLADAVSAKLTRYPVGLASALTKIAYSTHSIDDIDKVTSAAFISQPRGDMTITGKGSRTHPPIWNRIRILRLMSGGAGYIDYQKAYNAVMLQNPGFMPGSMRGDIAGIPLRMAEAMPDEPGGVDSLKEMSILADEGRIDDIFRLTEGYRFIDCQCGMKIKVPVDYDKFEIKCPRCGKIHKLGENMASLLTAMLDESAVTGETAAAEIIREVLTEKNEPDYSSEEEQTYVKVENSWQEILCKCGSKVQISPNFLGRFISCRKCKRRINIIYK
ncbi:MAG: M48 family metalloprotease [Candidatus Cloacimonetes bacterium]|nr:M48 family metalloprotease [Candidatus Cloacimonadota bacterium]